MSPLLDAYGREIIPDTPAPTGVPNTPENFFTMYCDTVARNDRADFRWTLRVAGLIERWNEEAACR